VVINGKAVGKYYWVTSGITFSPDSRRTGYIVQNEKKWIAVIDGKESDEYDEINNIAFSADSKKAGFTARRNNKWFVVVDGNEWGPYDKIRYFGFLKNCAVYLAKKGSLKFIMVDNKRILKTTGQVFYPYIYNDLIVTFIYKKKKLSRVICAPIKD
jgi:hypothetical protein